MKKLFLFLSLALFAQAYEPHYKKIEILLGKSYHMDTSYSYATPATYTALGFDISMFETNLLFAYRIEHHELDSTVEYYSDNIMFGYLWSENLSTHIGYALTTVPKLDKRNISLQMDYGFAFDEDGHFFVIEAMYQRSVIDNDHAFFINVGIKF
ncbi:MAG: hypothetical protein KU37_07440 [Sulfuricurvum sp. PC08-66]|nr:MAG: hypothetical protein KU37_07440 [Sulfuricurvum sp. PC08-66]